MGCGVRPGGAQGIKRRRIKATCYSDRSEAAISRAGRLTRWRRTRPWWRASNGGSAGGADGWTGLGDARCLDESDVKERGEDVKCLSPYRSGFPLVKRSRGDRWRAILGQSVLPAACCESEAFELQGELAFLQPLSFRAALASERASRPLRFASSARPKTPHHPPSIPPGARHLLHRLHGFRPCHRVGPRHV